MELPGEASNQQTPEGSSTSCTKAWPLAPPAPATHATDWEHSYNKDISILLNFQN